MNPQQSSKRAWTQSWSKQSSRASLPGLVQRIPPASLTSCRLSPQPWSSVTLRHILKEAQPADRTWPPWPPPPPLSGWTLWEGPTTQMYTPSLLRSRVPFWKTNTIPILRNYTRRSVNHKMFWLLITSIFRPSTFRKYGYALRKS